MGSAANDTLGGASANDPGSYSTPSVDNRWSIFLASAGALVGELPADRLVVPASCAAAGDTAVNVDDTAGTRSHLVQASCTSIAVRTLTGEPRRMPPHPDESARALRTLQKSGDRSLKSIFRIFHVDFWQCEKQAVTVRLQTRSASQGAKARLLFGGLTEQHWERLLPVIRVISCCEASFGRKAPASFPF